MKYFLWVLAVLLPFQAIAQIPFTLDPPAGTYQSNIILKAEASPGYTLDFRFQEAAGSPFIPWEDLPLSALPGEVRTYHLLIRASNSRSEVYQLSYQYRIDRTDLGESTPMSPPPTLSPPAVPGIFSPENDLRYDHRPWLILLDLQGRHTTYVVKSGSQEVLRGEYSGPVELPAGRNLVVEISVDGVMVGTRSYSAEDAILPPHFPRPGFHRKPLKLLPPEGRWTISLQGSAPGEWTGAFELTPQTNVRSTVHLVASSGGKNYRLAYVLDGRIPLPPSVRVQPVLPPVLEITTPHDGVPFVDNGEGKRGPVGPLYSLKNQESSINLFTQYPDGEVSPQIRVDSSLWRPYAVSPAVTVRSYGLEVVVPEGLQAVYELAQDVDKLRTPGSLSPRIHSGGVFPVVPRGYLFQTWIRISLMDASGHLGPPGPAQILKVDRRLPPTPAVTGDGKGFRLTGTGTLFYSLSSGEVPPQEMANLQVYTGAVSFPSSGDPGVETWWVTALARDSWGNESLSVREKFLLDNRPSGIYGFQGLEGRATLNSGEVTIIPEVTGVSGELWYTLTTDGTQPPDPKTLGILYPGSLTVKAQEGEELNLRSRWNLKTPEGWHHEQSVSLELILDRKPPQPPKTSPSAGRYELEGHRMEIRAQASEPGDRIFYTLKKGEGEKTQVVAEERPWPSALVLASEDREESVYGLKVWSVDPAGNSRELPPFLVVLNAKNNPPPKLTRLQIGPSEQFTVEFQPSEGIIRYEMSQGEAVPAIPTATSPVFPGKMDLKAREGTATVYQIRAVSQSSTGRLSPPTSVLKFVLIPEKISLVPRDKNSPDPEEGALRGLPAGNLSAEDLYLSLENPSKYRFTLGSGETSAMTVTPLSPSFPEVLAITVPAGRRERFRLLVQNKETLKIQDHIFVIDREPPEPPTPVLRRSGQELELSFLAQEGTVLKGSYTKRNFTHPALGSKGAISNRIRIPLDPDSWGDFSWEVLAQDEAGNQSSLAEKSVIWHNNVLFLDGSAPGEGDGTPQQPFLTLETVLKEALRTGIRRVVVAGGSYNCGSVDLRDMVLSGGFSSKTWTPDQGALAEFILEDQARWNIQGYSSLENLALKRDKGTESLLGVRDGRIAWSNLKVTSASEGELITFFSSRGRVQNLSVDHRGENPVVLLSLDHTDLEMSDLSLRQMGSRRAVSLRMVDSYLRAPNLTLNMAGGWTAFGVDLTSSTLETQEGAWTLERLRDSALLGVLEGSLWNDEGSRRLVESESTSTALFARNSQVRWRNGSLTMGAPLGKATGLNFRGRNRAFFQGETWKSGGGTILSGEKPGDWTWSSMTPEGWTQ